MSERTVGVAGDGGPAIPDSTGPLSAGTHYLQILREDHGGATGWTIEADATEGAPVPEPGALLLLGAGLAGLRLRRTARR